MSFFLLYMGFDSSKTGSKIVPFHTLCTFIKTAPYCLYLSQTFFCLTEMKKIPIKVRLVLAIFFLFMPLLQNFL